MSALITAFALTAAVTGQTSSVETFHIFPIDAIDVPATDPGKLTAINVEEGDSVTADQKLAQIDDTTAKMAVNVAKAKFESARKQAENDINLLAAEAQKLVYKAELEQAIEANNRIRKTVSATEVRRLRYQVKRGELGEKQAIFDQEVAAHEAIAAYSELQQAETMLGMREIKSPVTGVVTKVYLRKGNWAAPGDPVTRVVRMDTLRVKGSLNAYQYSQANVRGKRIKIVATLPGGRTENLSATIGFASEEINESARFEVWADVKNRQLSDGSWLLSPGLPAEVTVE